MAKYAYEYGKRWHVETPRYEIGRFVDKHHVGTSLDEIADKIIAAMDKDPRYTKAIRRECLAYAAIRHDRNRDLYQRVMSGNL